MSNKKQGKKRSIRRKWGMKINVKWKKLIETKQSEGKNVAKLRKENNVGKWKKWIKKGKAKNVNGKK